MMLAGRVVTIQPQTHGWIGPHPLRAAPLTACAHLAFERSRLSDRA